MISRTLFVLFCSAIVVACSDGSDSRPSVGYSALIERTQYGTAHVTADDWGSLGFGQGYATAQDRFCVLADQFLKVRSERARYFGPGENNENINSDFAYLALGVMDRSESVLESWSEDGKNQARGYVAGVNKYLKDTGVNNLPGECAGQAWVQEIDIDNYIAYAQALSMLAGSLNFIDAIATAAPPANPTLNSAATQTKPLVVPGASNAVALGGDRTVNGKGLLLANPHWPWEGERRLHEIHLTIPGVIDAAGATAPGVQGVLIGFNDSIAWSHTISTSKQFVIYSLNLVDGNPARYRFGGEERDMQAQSYTIEVQQEDGSLAEQSRTLYRSHYGPMLNPSIFGGAWSDAVAYSIFDPNNGYVRSANLAQAKSIDDLREVFLTQGGRPGNNTIATDRNGEVFYADTTLVPNISDEAEAKFRALVEAEEFSLTKLTFGLGFVLLDGSDPTFSIVEDDRATIPGVIPFDEAPQLVGRRDYVANSNDSYWLSNPAEPLKGYSIRYGDEETPRSLRTRLGLTQLSESTVWDRAGLKDLLFANRSYTAELWRDSFASYCKQFDEATSSSGERVNIVPACAVISNWDGRVDLESRGAILFREVMNNDNIYGVLGNKSYFTVPFDPLNPVETPNGLSDEGKEYLLGQLADAVLRLNGAGIAVDAPLGDYQYTIDGGQRFAVHGGRTAFDGAFNIVAYVDNLENNSTLMSRIPTPPLINPKTNLFEGGYLINYGSSFIMAVEFTDIGPVADAILTYSQSDDPESPHSNDQMPLYSSKTWRPLPFTREQIEADPALTSMRVTQ